LETKTQGIQLPQGTVFCRLTGLMAHKMGGWVLAGALAASLAAAGVQPAVAQGAAEDAVATGTLATGTGASMAAAPKNKIGPAAPVTYANKWELFGGLNFQNFMGGQNLPTRMNMGGGEVLGTYWLTPKWGLGAEWRGDWGTTPVKPNIQFNGRALASLNGGLLGAQYRGPKNQYAALNYHGYFGVSHGKFDYTVPNPTVLGMYTNRTKPIAAIGGSVDFNYSKNIAIRLSPDLILEHFGSEWREFFGISGGVVWRIGKR